MLSEREKKASSAASGRRPQQALGETTDRHGDGSRVANGLSYDLRLEKTRFGIPSAVSQRSP